MDQPSNANHWRQMFERGRRDEPPANDGRFPFGQLGAAPQTAPFGGFDDGYEPPTHDGGERGSLSHADIADEAAMALAIDTTDYKPWIIQRGRSRPAMMLHLRRFEQKSRLWMGWQIAYPHLIAVEYVGDTVLSLDFGARQFVIEGTGLGELARHLQSGSVLMVQEYAERVWNTEQVSQVVKRLTKV